MNLKIAIQPVEEPVTLNEAKAHLRVDIDDDNAIIYMYQRAARQICEDIARRAFISRTYDLFLNDWWGSNGVKIPMPPLQEVAEITYTDSGGTSTVLDPSMYVVDAAGEPGRIVWANGKTAPSIALQAVNGVRIRYVAGYGDTDDVPDMYKAALLLTLGHLYENRENVGFQAANKLPMGAESILMMDRGYR